MQTLFVHIAYFCRDFGSIRFLFRSESYHDPLAHVPKVAGGSETNSSPILRCFSTSAGRIVFLFVCVFFFYFVGLWSTSRKEENVGKEPLLWFDEGCCPVVFGWLVGWRLAVWDGLSVPFAAGDFGKSPRRVIVEALSGFISRKPGVPWKRSTDLCNNIYNLQQKIPDPKPPRSPHLQDSCHNMSHTILPSYIGIMIDHYKDPYQPTSIMESRRVFFVAHMSSVQNMSNIDFF